MMLNNNVSKLLDSLKKKIEDVETEELSFMQKEKMNVSTVRYRQIK